MNCKVASITIILFALLLISKQGQAQDEVLQNTKSALTSANQKTITTYFNDIVEISFEGEKARYSKTQAEFVMRDFFRKYPPQNFEFIHRGSSKEGLKYAIGKYAYNEGSFRVYILIKQFKGNYLIDTLDFSEE